ncbi:MAG: glycosyltransferase family 4 protein [Lentisphaerae bacterium]|nr:glycosyltransferase family 4 protein [Lentisphaerota bacterium]
MKAESRKLKPHAILWLHQYFSTPKGWGAVRTHALGRRLVQAGHAVDVVCGGGYDGSLKRTGYRPVAVDGMRVFVSGTAYRPHMGFARRIVSFLSFLVFALAFVVRRGRRYDVIIASSGPLTLALPALAGHGLYRKPFVFEVIDVWPDSAIAAGVLRNPALKWISFKLEALAYRHAAAVVTCSTGMTERVKRKLEHQGSVRPALLTIPNGCDLEQFVPDEARRRAMRQRLGVGEGDLVAIYAGAMGVSNAVGDLADAVARTAADGKVVWWFAGDGPEAETLRRVVRAGRGRWFGPLPREELVGLYLAADVNVVTFRSEPLFYENSPNKFFDGIAAGLPAVFNRTTWLEPWLAEYDCGLICGTETPGAWMAEALRDLAADGLRLQRMKRGARRLAEEVFNREEQAKRYLEVLESCLIRS